MEYKIQASKILICADNHIFARRTYELFNSHSPALSGFAQSDKKLADFSAFSPITPATSARSSWRVKPA
jgi:hypothetical protein